MSDVAFGPDYIIKQTFERVQVLTDQIAVCATKAEVAFLSARIDGMVPRDEHKVHWQRDDDRFNEMRTDLQRLETKVSIDLERMEGKIDNINENRLPRWGLTVIGIIISVLIVLATHFWR